MGDYTKEEYASKGVAGTGLGIAGTTLGLLNNNDNNKLRDVICPKVMPRYNSFIVPTTTSTPAA